MRQRPEAQAVLWCVSVAQCFVTMRAYLWWYHAPMSAAPEPQVGIRDLKEHASALIRRVAAGETITITDRGRPVARIVPLREHDAWRDRMVEEGRLVPARRDMLQVLLESPPPPLMPGERSPFEVLMELRADER